MSQLKKYLKEFHNKNVVVIGDVMLDKYIFGKVERISPEAPVQIVTIEKEKYVPGGAANAASNVSTLNGNAYLFGIVGNDIAKNIFLDEAEAKGINTKGIVIDGRKPTIQKTRVLAQNQQLLRIDNENSEYIDNDANEKIFETIKEIDKIDIIIISDYAKGTITKKLMENIKEYAKKNSILLIIDPKPKHKLFYKGCSLITPNKKEAEEMAGILLETQKDLEKAGNKLMEEMDCNILITTGEKGMSIFEKNKEPLHIQTLAKEVYDVSGAGDTVIATLSLALSAGAALSDAAILANHAAGIKVGKLGTSPVTLAELEESLNNNGE
ncbi:MAG: D-glycero-beta-D-manno-heptose-7-phosphate kinase [Nanoarchaeota archaeon]|nr:D-glycero-beta-D-manno-heptose-7-phosphate kinase [Nanoarchaeota archaeon]